MTEILQDEENFNYIKKLNEIKHDKTWHNFVVIGLPGVGKTFLTTKLLPHDLFVREIKFKLELTAKNLRLAKPDERNYKNMFLLEQMIKAKTMIYDDYGSCDPTPAYIEKMLFWIDERNRRGLKTIYTTNLTKEAFESRDGRIASRILDDAIVMIMAGKDRRKKNLRILT